MSNNRAAAERLAFVVAESTKHMEHDERADCIETALDDLHLLAKRDGCIAAAWAWEFLTTIAADPTEWGPGWLQQMPEGTR